MRCMYWERNRVHYERNPPAQWHIAGALPSTWRRSLMPSCRLASRPLALLLTVLSAVLTLTTACANGTTRASTATTSPTATSTLPTSSQVTAYVGAGDHVYALDGHTGTVKWTYVTGHGVGAGGIDSVTVAVGTVFVHGTGADTNGQSTRGIYALDTTTGNLRWTLSPAADQLGGPSALGSAKPIAVVGGLVYLFAPGSQVPSGVYAVDLATGNIVWSANTFGASMARVDSRAVYVTQLLGGSSAQGPTDETLTAFDRRTGAQLWQVHSLRGEVLSGNVLYATSFNAGDSSSTSSPSTLSALDTATGTAIWTKPLVGDASLQLIDMTLYVADQSGVSALDPATGQERWHHDTPGSLSGSTGIDGDGATLCLGYRDQSTAHMIGVDAATGAQRWIQDVPAPTGGYGGSSGSGGGACYARMDQPSTSGSMLRRVDAATGTTSWTVDTGGQVAGRLYILSDAIVTDTSHGQHNMVVKALSVADGSTLWQFTPDVDFPGELTVG